jgi:hypothetical protein
VPALFGKLDAIVYNKADFSLELKSTVVNDRGQNSAESKWGADFGIVASISSPRERVDKGVLGQAERGSLIDLAPAQAQEFRQQVVKMSAATAATIGFEVPMKNGALPNVRILEVPRLYQGVPIQRFFRNYEGRIPSNSSADPPVLLGEAIPLGRYLYGELIRCLHGDDNDTLVKGISDSSLTNLRIVAQSL